ncbi:MAG: hypothetical protein QM608_12900 [Caulobacter sp.]
MVPFLVAILVVLSLSGVLSAERRDGGEPEPWATRKAGLVALLAPLLMFLFPRPAVPWVNMVLLAGWAVLAAGVLLDGRIARIAGAAGGAILAAMGLWILLRDGVSAADALPPLVAAATLAVFAGVVLLGRRRAA